LQCSLFYNDNLPHATWLYCIAQEQVSYLLQIVLQDVKFYVSKMAVLA
jgi:hypothetical protein